MDWTKNFGRKQVGRKLGARFKANPINGSECWFIDVKAAFFFRPTFVIINFFYAKNWVANGRIKSVRFMSQFWENFHLNKSHPNNSWISP